MLPVAVEGVQAASRRHPALVYHIELPAAWDTL